MIITLELPDDIANWLERLPPEERNTFAIAAMREKLEAKEEEFEMLKGHPGMFPNQLRRGDCTPEEITSIEAGFADVVAGRVTDGDTFFAEMRQHLTQLKRQGSNGK